MARLLDSGCAHGQQTQPARSLASRLSYYGFLIAGGILLAVPRILGPAMESRFHDRTPVWLLLTGASVAFGLAFSIAARVWLGHNWSADVTIKQDHELVRGGPYALVRHPIYSGVLLALASTALAIGSGRALTGLALAVVGFVRKLAIEERFMTDRFGDAYTRYCAEVPALIPFVV